MKYEELVTAIQLAEAEFYAISAAAAGDKEKMEVAQSIVDGLVSKVKVDDDKEYGAFSKLRNLRRELDEHRIRLMAADMAP